MMVFNAVLGGLLEMQCYYITGERSGRMLTLGGALLNLALYGVGVAQAMPAVWDRLSVFQLKNAGLNFSTIT